MTIKKCAKCGNDFEAYSTRAMYCPDCRKIRQIERNEAYAENRRNGKNREVGSTQICPYCKEEYILKTGSQICCNNCQKKHNNKIKSPGNNMRKNKNYDQMTFLVPKGEREKLTEYISSTGMSINEFVNNAIAEYKEKLNKN